MEIQRKSCCLKERNKNPVGFSQPNPVSETNEEIVRVFSPEFRNRLDEVIHFQDLSPDLMPPIVDKFISELQEQLQEQTKSTRLSITVRILSNFLMKKKSLGSEVRFR